MPSSDLKRGRQDDCGANEQSATKRPKVWPIFDIAKRRSTDSPSKQQSPSPKHNNENEASNSPKRQSSLFGNKIALASSISYPLTTSSPPPNVPQEASSPVPRTRHNPTRQASLATPLAKLDLSSTTPNSSPSIQRVSNKVTTPRPTVAQPVSSPLTKSLNSTRTQFQTPEKANQAAIAAGQGDEIQHPHLKYKFMYPPQRRDIKKRPPHDPDYDERTLYVPESFLDSQTPALRQWWLIKQHNMDAIIFFKMGKFYELFNEDAVIGVNNLEIMYMKGDESKPAHAGFPEVSYDKYSTILIDKGFKVLRVEQTETPAMMEDRCRETGRKGRFDKVVKREVCRITTKGTRMLGIMESVFHTCRNQYLLAIYESSGEAAGVDGSRVTQFGVCFIDITVSRLYIGQFEDDHNQSRLNILLAHHNPTEVLYERKNLSQQTHQALLKTGAVLTMLKPSKEFWPIQKALGHIKTHMIFKNEEGQFEWPSLMKELFEEESENLLGAEPKEKFKLALNCFGAIVYYLQDQLIATQALQCTSFELYTSPLSRSVNNLKENSFHIPSMILDHIALRNLEIFENSTGGTNSTVFSSINSCKTHFGQRLLRNWLCSPLCDIRQINNRLDAVQALISNENASLMNEFSHVLSQTPDLERLLSKIKTQCFKSESDSRAIMFDGNHYSRAKITSFLNLLSNFKRLQKFITSISKSMQNCNSQILKRLLSFTTDGGLYPDYSSTLDYFESAFDHDTARKTGQIIPSPGVDKNYDRLQNQIDGVKEKLDRYLDKQKDLLGCRHIEYFGTAKNRYQIQVPEAYCKKVPSDYRIETTRKGFKRYYTPEVVDMFQQLTIYEEEMKRTLDSIMSVIFEQFSRKTRLWSAAIECMAVLDVLQSIASFVRSLIGNNVDVCRPEMVEKKDSPFIDYKDGRHPALVKKNPDYIANDLVLDEKLILLSGANMGGKSTLMRQTALMVVLAQIGSFVPASKMRLTPVDRIFSRLGASDKLLEGESTFYTELVETSAMIECATSDSLLLLDELGRGTSTYDGTAIAYSVLQEISTNIKCRCLFSTHYHTLVRDFQSAENIRLAHMACKIEKKSCEQEDLSDPLKENITFLFKIAEGPVGRSYGFNVAKLAGIEDEIIKDALRKSKELEMGCQVLDAMQRISIKNGQSPGRIALKNQVLNTLSGSKW